MLLQAKISKKISAVLFLACFSENGPKTEDIKKAAQLGQPFNIHYTIVF